MLESLKGAALYVAGIIVLSALGAATYLASQGTLSGSDWLVIAASILASVGIVTSAHVAGQTAAAAINTPPPVSSGDPPHPAAPGVGLPDPQPGTGASHPAMPQEV